jgi:gluconokinase
MPQFVVMGVSGCGKSSVAKLLAERTHGSFLDADDFHPASNRARMATGIPLQDEDRWEWLDALNVELKSRAHSPKKTFLACSSLKQVYRDRLAADLSGLCFIYLQGSKQCILGRLAQRTDHFMPESLLESQFAILEEPTDSMTVSVEQPLEAVVAEVLKRI